VGALTDPATLRAVAAERAMNLHLHGDCNVPIAGYCMEVEAGLALWGLVGDAATGRLVRAEAVGPADAPETLGDRVAVMLLERGAEEILRGR
ncbi:MAG TPA: hydroxymethylbilane synthase, partial [Rhodanobacteraceae bacterium]|nr:hydroxymethylbilane synthase [Rhodanobacteraceae bacterium]